MGRQRHDDTARLGLRRCHCRSSSRVTHCSIWCRARALRTRSTLRGNFAAEHEIGRRFRIDPASLPPPNLQRSVRNGPRAIPYAGQRLNVPPGFTATPFATGIRNPRRLLVLPNGDVLVAQQSEGDVLLLRDDGSGRAVSRERYAGGFNGPYGLAWRDGALLVADQDGIWRVSEPRRAVRTGDRPGRIRGR